METDNSYVDRKGRIYGLATLGADEMKLVRRLQAHAKKNPTYFDFRNFWVLELKKFGDSRGITRRETIQSTAYRIAQDLGSRIAIAAGYAKPSDYRSELEFIIQTKFRTRREFCEATGLSEDMLSHVLARRKNLALETLADALAHIGYTIHIAPLPDAK
jgi:hypothetical protein